VPTSSSFAPGPLPEGFSLRRSPIASDREGFSLQTTAEDVAISRADEATLRQALSVWPRIALLSFGSPAVQLAAMYRILVEEKRWISRGRFKNSRKFAPARKASPARIATPRPDRFA
jgi:hypothetical protein